MATTAVDFDNAWAVGLANGERGVKTRGWRASEDLRRRFRMGEHDSPLFFDRSQIMAPQNRCLIPPRFPEWINAKRDFERNEFSAALFHFHPACPFFNRVIILSRCHSFVPIGRIHYEAKRRLYWGTQIPQSLLFGLAEPSVFVSLLHGIHPIIWLHIHYRFVSSWPFFFLPQAALIFVLPLLGRPSMLWYLSLLFHHAHRSFREKKLQNQICFQIFFPELWHFPSRVTPAWNLSPLFTFFSMEFQAYFFFPFMLLFALNAFLREVRSVVHFSLFFLRQFGSYVKINEPNTVVSFQYMTPTSIT